MSGTVLRVDDVCQWLEALAPLPLTEEWDNTGLLIGDRSRRVERVMTCLTATRQAVDEAIAEKVDLIITHHPLPFRPIKRITRNDPTGSLLLDLIESKVALYSPHTAFDSAQRGINQRIAEGLGLVDIRPLRIKPTTGVSSTTDQGSGRWGRLPKPMTDSEWFAQVAKFFRVEGLHAVSGSSGNITHVGVACGAAGEYLSDAARVGCQAFVTGELRFHSALEAQTLQVSVAVPGHHATERFALEQLASEMTSVFPALRIWASRSEQDPMVWFTNKSAN